MFDYKRHFDTYCKENGLELSLCFDMPEGYETANGMFDDGTKTVYINAKLLEATPDFEKAFYLFHELRHAAQYLKPEQFPELIRRSLQYVIQYNGTCYKLVNGDYAACELEGGEERFTELYLGQPHEADANHYAFEQTRKILGEPEELKKLYGFWTPKQPIPDETYETVYAEIDEKVDNRTVRYVVPICQAKKEGHSKGAEERRKHGRGHSVIRGLDTAGQWFRRKSCNSPMS